eukprot:gnl/MRDRNA2_/MRDRNA2_194573_c0_seq1.p1 gnl/MRDRNA2_/MRDRNA2_194573_c0~~gnl/MRDRNA2_/MRDRNA2_194573_c0_seq1.p1  ORF type:complete len:327 (+),score=49.01 gnl/MRDRNA2_/MRDRNA2_194573_c0_seq1:144-1124(+)
MSELDAEVISQCIDQVYSKTWMNFQTIVAERIHEITSKAELKAEVQTRYKEFMEIVSAALVRQNLYIWVLRIGRSSGIARCAFPEDAVHIIVSYVGDGTEMNPMSATLARALERARCRWRQFERELMVDWRKHNQRKLVGKMIQEISLWWDHHGGKIVGDSIKNNIESESNCEVRISIGRDFPCMKILLQSLVEENLIAEESNVLKKLIEYFSAAPRNFKVGRVKLHGMAPKEVDVEYIQLLQQCNQASIQSTDFVKLIKAEPSFSPGDEVIVDGRRGRIRFITTNLKAYVIDFDDGVTEGHYLGPWIKPPHLTEFQDFSLTLMWG